MINNSDIERVIEDVNYTKPFSGTILIKDNDKIFFQRAYGFANRSDSICINMETKFGIASGCKIFTAAAICQLVQKGIISFDTLLKDCLDISFEHMSSSISIHHLLTHSSGITDYFDEDIMDNYGALWYDRPMYRMNGPKDFLPMFENGKMKFMPGERFYYNNAGFILLGLVIEKLTHMSFRDYVEKNIFGPCGMKSSGYFALDKLPGNTALGYIEDEFDGSWKTNIYSIPIIGGPDGGAFVTAPDMMRFWEGLFGYKLLSKEFTEKLMIPYISAGGDDYYGYGIWIRKRIDAVLKYYLMGEDPGVSFRSSVYPQHGIKVVVTSNYGSGSGKISSAIDKYILDNVIYKESSFHICDSLY